jgi:hypothetical protein
MRATIYVPGDAAALALGADAVADAIAATAAARGIELRLVRNGTRGMVWSGLRGRGGAAFPAGIKWKHRARRRRRTKVRRVQRRRGRLRHLLRPHADGGRPVRA